MKFTTRMLLLVSCSKDKRGGARDQIWWVVWYDGHQFGGTTAQCNASHLPRCRPNTHCTGRRWHKGGWWKYSLTQNSIEFKIQIMQQGAEDLPVCRVGPDWCPRHPASLDSLPLPCVHIVNTQYTHRHLSCSEPLWIILILEMGFPLHLQPGFDMHAPYSQIGIYQNWNNFVELALLSVFPLYSWVAISSLVCWSYQRCSSHVQYAKYMYLYWIYTANNWGYMPDGKIY